MVNANLYQNKPQTKPNNREEFFNVQWLTQTGSQIIYLHIKQKLHNDEIPNVQQKAITNANPITNGV